MVAKIEYGTVALYSRNGKVISNTYIEVVKALEGMIGDAVINGELVALDKKGVSHFQLLQNARRHEAKLLYCVFDFRRANGIGVLRQSNAASGLFRTAIGRLSRKTLRMM
jgi:bifunctional non-homologous end joining protein LigD